MDDDSLVVTSKKQVTIVGAGLAGCEAAWQLANGGVRVKLYESKPVWKSPAHNSEGFAELICSNSLRSIEKGHASALLKEEMNLLGSLVMEAAFKTRLPAGKALAVDRELFSKYVTDKISDHSNIEIVRKEVVSLSEIERPAIIATGPLTSEKFANSLIEHFKTKLPADYLYFYDAIAPIVEADSIDMNIAFRASRYNVGTQSEGDYLNCPMDEETYYRFIEALLEADQIAEKSFDNIKCFEGCMPIEEMASRHKDALRHGPMKPMGIEDPKGGKRPYAVVQLRQDNQHATLFNMVGFQTRMKYAEQDKVFRLIPGLRDARFLHYGSMHRNTYVNGPALLDQHFKVKWEEELYIIGQLSGVEGYLESASTGTYLGFILFKGLKTDPIPATTAIGALINHVVGSDVKDYQPMKINWGIFPPPAIQDGVTSTRRSPKKDQRRNLLIERGRSDFQKWLK